MSEKKKSSNKGKSYIYYSTENGTIRMEEDGRMEYVSKDKEIRFVAPLSRVVEIYLKHKKNEKSEQLFQISKDHILSISVIINHEISAEDRIKMIRKEINEEYKKRVNFSYENKRMSEFLFKKASKYFDKL